MSATKFERIVCAIAIIGDSLGAVACAIALGRLLAPGQQVVMVTQAAWLGGQVTNQGVSALDEHQYVELSGTTTAGYHDFRRRIRTYYQQKYHAPATMPISVLGANMPLNPGDAWVSRLAFDPRIGAEILESMLPAQVARLHGQAISAEVIDGRIANLQIQTHTGEVSLSADYYIDATDLGDLLPLTGMRYITGAEAQADTGEADAPFIARPDEIQSFTYCFAVEYRPGEDHTIPAPQGYETFRFAQPYTLAPVGHDGEPVVYRMFEDSPQGNLPFWTYRRIHAADWLGGNDIALINWVSNDYFGGDITNASPQARQRHLDEARRLSLGFLYWLQTACPRDEGGYGYPEFKLRPDVMGTADGLSQMPYIRESRRIHALTRIVASDISAADNGGVRARHFADSGGIGWYSMDLHPCVGNRDASRYAPTRPFQIPLGALLPTDAVNLIAGCKNIGTTHLTNGAYRLHPIEWAIGEMAATLAAHSLHTALTPREIWQIPEQLAAVQADLARGGCPLVWAVDVPYELPDGTLNPLFVPTQRLLTHAIIQPGSARWHSLTIAPDDILGDDFDLSLLQDLAGKFNVQARIQPSLTWRDLCQLFMTVW